MTRRRDIQRRFLERNGWCFDSALGTNIAWYNYTTHANLFENGFQIERDREDAFQRELKRHGKPVRERLARQLRNAI